MPEKSPEVEREEKRIACILDGASPSLAEDILEGGEIVPEEPEPTKDVVPSTIDLDDTVVEEKTPLTYKRIFKKLLGVMQGFKWDHLDQLDLQMPATGTNQSPSAIAHFPHGVPHSTMGRALSLEDSQSDFFASEASLIKFSTRLSRTTSWETVSDCSTSFSGSSIPLIRPYDAVLFYPSSLFFQPKPVTTMAADAPDNTSSANTASTSSTPEETQQAGSYGSSSSDSIHASDATHEDNTEERKAPSHLSAPVLGASRLKSLRPSDSLDHIEEERSNEIDAALRKGKHRKFRAFRSKERIRVEAPGLSRDPNEDWDTPASPAVSQPQDRFPSHKQNATAEASAASESKKE